MTTQALNNNTSLHTYEDNKYKIHFKVYSKGIKAKVWKKTTDSKITIIIQDITYRVFQNAPLLPSHWTPPEILKWMLDSRHRYVIDLNSNNELTFHSPLQAEVSFSTKKKMISYPIEKECKDLGIRTPILELKDGMLVDVIGTMTRIRDGIHVKCLQILKHSMTSIISVIELENGGLAFFATDSSIEIWTKKKGKYLKCLSINDSTSKPFEMGLISSIKNKDWNFDPDSISNESIIQLLKLRDFLKMSCKPRANRSQIILLQCIKLKYGGYAFVTPETICILHIKNDVDDSSKILRDIIPLDLNITSGQRCSLVELQDGSLAIGYSNGIIQIWNRWNTTCIQTLKVTKDAQLSSFMELGNGNLAIVSRTKENQWKLDLWDRAIEKHIACLFSSDLEFAVLEQRNGNLLIKSSKGLYILERTISFEEDLEDRDGELTTTISMVPFPSIFKAPTSTKKEPSGEKLSKLLKIVDEDNTIQDEILERFSSLPKTSTSEEEEVSQENLETRIEEYLKKVGEYFQENFEALSRDNKVIQEKLNPIHQEFQEKQAIYAEKQALEESHKVRTFYNQVEKEFGARLFGCMVLYSGRLKRADTKYDTAGKIGGTAGSLLFKFLGGAAALATFGGSIILGEFAAEVIDKGISKTGEKIADHQSKKRAENTMESITSFKKAMKTAELTARRLSQAFRSTIEQEERSIEDIRHAATNAVNAMENYIFSGALVKELPIEEKITQLIQVVITKAGEEKGLFFRSGCIFRKAVKATDPIPKSSKTSLRTKSKISSDPKQVHSDGVSVGQLRLKTQELEQRIKKLEEEGHKSRG